MGSPVFKALTRPALFWGIPIVPFLSVCLIFILLSIWIGVFYTKGISLLLLLPVILFYMRHLCKTDGYMFRLIYLNFMCRTPAASKKFFKCNAYFAEDYRKPDSNNKREKIMDIDIFNMATYSKYIPYSTMIEDGMVMTRDGLILCTVSISGVPFLTVDYEELKTEETYLNTIIRSYAGKPISFYVHSVRSDAKDQLKSDFRGNEYLTTIDNLYYEGFKNSTFKTNVYYLTIIYNPFENKTQKTAFKTIKNKEKNDFIGFHIKQMENYKNQFIALLNKYNPRFLGNEEIDGVIYSDQLSFYNFLITNQWEKVKVNDGLIYNSLGNVDLFFNQNVGEVRSNEKSKFFQCIEIRSYENEVGFGFFDALLNAKGDYVLTHSYVPLPAKIAKDRLEKQKNFLSSVKDDAVGQIKKLNKAKEDLASDIISFGEYHFSLMVYGDTIEDVMSKSNNANTILSNLGLITSVASVALSPSFWAQFPSNFIYRPRVPTMSSANFSDLIGLHNLISGKPHDNAWGDAVTLFRTPSGQPYYFSYHIYDKNKSFFGEKVVGHTLILGSSGVGKTALMCFLANQSRKFAAPKTFPQPIEDNSVNVNGNKLLTIYFDKDKGAMGNILASGGIYLAVKTGKKTGFAPFKCKKTPKAISDLCILIQLLVTRRGEKLTTLQEMEISHAVNAVMSLDLEYRGNGITRLIENLPKGTTEAAIADSVSSRLSLWAKSGQYGWVFDNEEDLLNFDEKDIYGIDGTEFLDDPNTCAPIAFYLINKIYGVMDGRRGILNVDELWKYLEDEELREALKNLLVTARKSDWLLVMGTQSPDQILKSSISSELIEQTENILLLPNPKAKWDDYQKLNITKKEFTLIKNLDKNSRQFLISNSNGSTLCSFDLSSIGKYMKIISTSKDNSSILEEVIEQYGDKPEIILNTYMNRII